MRLSRLKISGCVVLAAALACGASQPSRAEGPAEGCFKEYYLTLFEQAKSDRTGYRAIEASLRTRRPPNAPTVELGPTVEEQNPKGAQRELHKIEGMPWESIDGAASFAPQGDPRTFIRMAKSLIVGKFFGFEIKDPNTVLVPLEQRFNWAIDAINSLSDRLKISFKFVLRPGKLSNLEYIEGFARHEEIPFSDDPALQLHDLNYHAEVIFLPEEVIAVAKRHARAVLDFREYALKNAPELMADPEIAQGFERIILATAEDLDSGTGNFVSHRDNPYEQSRAVWGNLVHEVRSVRQQLGYLLRMTLSRAVRTEEVSQLLEKFSGTQAEDPTFTQRYEWNDRKFLRQVADRRNRIKAAVLLYGLKHP